MSINHPKATEDSDIQTKTARTQYGNLWILHYDRNHEFCATVHKHPEENRDVCPFCQAETEGNR